MCDNQPNFELHTRCKFLKSTTRCKTLAQTVEQTTTVTTQGTWYNIPFDAARIAAKLIDKKNITSMAVTVNDASSVFSTELETFSLRKCGNSLYIWHTNSRLGVSCFSSCHGLTAQSVTYIKRKTKRYNVALLNCLCKSEGIITILSRFDIRNARLVVFTSLRFTMCGVFSFVIHYYLCHLIK